MITLKKMNKMNLKCLYFNVSEKQKFDRYHYSICVDSFLNHDYTEEDEKDEFKVSLFHLLQCKHGSETNQQYSITRNLFSAHKYS